MWGQHRHVHYCKKLQKPIIKQLTLKNRPWAFAHQPKYKGSHKLAGWLPKCFCIISIMCDVIRNCRSLNYRSIWVIVMFHKPLTDWLESMSIFYLYFRVYLSVESLKINKTVLLIDWEVCFCYCCHFGCLR